MAAQKIDYKSIYAKADSAGVKKEIIEFKKGKTVIKAEFYYDIPLSERAIMAIEIANMLCRYDDDGEMVYAPYLLEFAKKYSAISHFTNIELPEDPSSAQRFIDGSTVYSELEKIVSNELLENIYAGAEKLIDYKLQKDIHASQLGAFLKALTSTIASISDNFEGLDEDETVEKLKELLNAGGAGIFNKKE